VGLLSKAKHAIKKVAKKVKKAAKAVVNAVEEVVSDVAETVGNGIDVELRREGSGRNCVRALTPGPDLASTDQFPGFRRTPSVSRILV